MKTHSYITLGAQFGPVKTWRFAKREAILRSLPAVSVSHSLGAASGHATERGMRGFAKQNFQLLKICEGCVKVRAWKYHLWNDICIYVFLCHVSRYTTLVADVHYSDVNSCLSAIDQVVCARFNSLVLWRYLLWPFLSGHVQRLHVKHHGPVLAYLAVSSRTSLVMSGRWLVESADRASSPTSLRTSKNILRFFSKKSSNLRVLATRRKKSLTKCPCLKLWLNQLLTAVVSGVAQGDNSAGYVPS